MAFGLANINLWTYGALNCIDHILAEAGYVIPGDLIKSVCWKDLWSIECLPITMITVIDIHMRNIIFNKNIIFKFRERVINSQWCHNYSVNRDFSNRLTNYVCIDWFTHFIARKIHKKCHFWILICCRMTENLVQLLNPPSDSLFVYRQSSLCQFVKVHGTPLIKLSIRTYQLG